MNREKTTPEEYLNQTGTLIYTNVGSSMMPLLRQGRDIMVIKKRGPERLKKYDAVLFRRKNGQYVLHRILKVRELDYYIVGDNCLKGEYVAENQILGILTEVQRGKKKISATDLEYRIYVHLWCDFFSLRCFLIKSRNALGAARRKLCRRKQ